MDYQVETYRTGALADILTCQLMPEQVGASERTFRARLLGAYSIMDHLAEGEWDRVTWNKVDDRAEQMLQEFLKRVVANAARQGITLDLSQTNVEAIEPDSESVDASAE